jgi:hypothetical protein
MKTINSGLIEVVRDKIVDAWNNPLATGKVGTSLTDIIADVAGSAVRDAVQFGINLRRIARGTMIGVLSGVQDMGVAPLDSISHTSHAAIRSTVAVGGDLAAATSGLVEGAIEGAKKMGISAEEAAAAAANGALKAAGQVGSTTVEAVRKAVTRPVNGAKVELKKPMSAASWQERNCGRDYDVH